MFVQLQDHQMTDETSSMYTYLGVSLNGGTSISHPKWSFLVGKPMVVGYYHFRKPPYIFYAAINSNKYQMVTAQLIN